MKGWALALGCAVAVAGCKEVPFVPPPELDAVFADLLKVQPPFQKPPIFVTDIDALVNSGLLGEVTQQFEAAARADSSVLSKRGRIVLQNDTWGLVQRLKRVAAVSAELRSLHDAAVKLVHKLALSDDDLLRNPQDRLPKDAPAVVRALSEYGSELASLQHERLYGYRRIFRIFQQGSNRALMSQLVAIDTHGRPYLTSVVGEVEALAFDADTIVAAEVHHLKRHENYLNPTLEPIQTIEHIPADGAHAYLVQLRPAVPLADLPCTQCHRNGFRMSLPLATATPGKRWALLLNEVVEDRRLSATATIAEHP